MRSTAEEEEEKPLHLLEGILLKLMAFCEKTRNAYKELKDGVPSALDVFKQVKVARGLRLTLLTPKPCVSVAVQVATAPAMVAERLLCRDISTDTPYWWPAPRSHPKEQLQKQQSKEQQPKLQQPKPQQTKLQQQPTLQHLKPRHLKQQQQLKQQQKPKQQQKRHQRQQSKQQRR